MRGEPLGLIAGSGDLPLLVARGAVSAGRSVVCVGIHGCFDPRLPALCSQFEQAGLVQIGRWVRLLRRGGVREAVMVGGVRKTRMHDPWKLFRQVPDWRAARLWYRRLRHDRRNHAVLAAVADELALCGVPLMDSTTFIQDHLATSGVMGRVQPDAGSSADMAFGWPLLLQMVELDIGQSIAVRDRDVIAVEAIEGTDAMIERAGQLCRTRGWTLLKTAKSAHDRRADVPTIGVATIERAAAAGCRSVALGSGRVILVDKSSVIASADRLGVALLGMG
ncbi:MAG: LpxI family protein [Phycisphaerales bacterium]|jgi:DUF1009 family protein